MKNIDTTTLNRAYLESIGACKQGIDFVVNNNLEHFPVSRVNEIEGDEFEWVEVLEELIATKREYDDQNRIVLIDDGAMKQVFHYEGNVCYITLLHRSDKAPGFYSNQFRHKRYYDDRGNVIRFTTAYTETFFSFDEHNRMTRVYQEDILTEELLDDTTYAYDEHGNMTSMVKCRGHYTEIVVYHYDERGNCTGEYSNKGRKIIQKFDDKDNLIFSDVNNSQYTFPITYYDNGQLKSYGRIVLPNVS